MKSQASSSEEKMSGPRQVIHVLAAVLVVAVLPALLMGVIVGPLGATATLIGLVLGVAGSKISGTSRILLVAPLIGIAAGLGVLTAYDWWWVVLLSVAALVAGSGIASGWFPPLLMIPFAATFVAPVTSVEDAVIYGVICAVATGYGVVLARHFGAADVVDGDHLSIPAAAGVAIVFATVLGVSAAFGVALGWTEPYWVPDPVLVLVLYILMGKRERIQEKAVGTAIGATAAIPVALLSPSAGVLVGTGIVAFLIALTQAKRYWLMYGLYTFSLVLILATPGHVEFEAEERGLQILIGIGLLVVGLTILGALGAWITKRYPQLPRAVMASD